MTKTIFALMTIGFLVCIIGIMVFYVIPMALAMVNGLTF